MAISVVYNVESLFLSHTIHINILKLGFRSIFTTMLSFKEYRSLFMAARKLDKLNPS